VFILVVFVAVYAGMALGRWPGLRIDRTGIALLGAILLYAGDAVNAAEVLDAVDFPTLIVLFGLMILSAQFAASGFYDWCSAKIAGSQTSPPVMLATTVLVAGGLSAVLANDVIVFAMTPLLCVGLRRRGLDPRPFLIALAGAANAGSAATVIGNPQNILISQVGRLDFWNFLAACGPPAAAALIVVYACVLLTWRKALRHPSSNHLPAAAPIANARGWAEIGASALHRQQLAKSVFATAVLLALFMTPLPQVEGVLLIAGYLLVSREMSTRNLLGLVDWHLLVLFAGLFVVTRSLTDTGLPGEAIVALAHAGLPPDRLATLAPLALLGSNSIGNVPLVILLLTVLPSLPPGTLYALALLSTLAGNLLLVGSLANIIMIERARDAGVTLGFIEHARSGIPMALSSMALAIAWLWWRGVAS
jgi:Na+/H+ antiporter NhaD/arsenite permease-like protein